MTGAFDQFRDGPIFEDGIIERVMPAQFFVYLPPEEDEFFRSSKQRRINTKFTVVYPCWSSSTAFIELPRAFLFLEIYTHFL